jgi:hypothetical protein
MTGGPTRGVPADPAFDRASPSTRAGIFFDRMVRERLLDAACVVLTDRATGAVRCERETLSFPL